MAIDVNIFISNKNDEFQKALAILEVAKDINEIEYFSKKHFISKDILKACEFINKKLDNKEISFKTYNSINIDNYKKYL